MIAINRDWDIENRVWFIEEIKDTGVSVLYTIPKKVFDDRGLVEYCVRVKVTKGVLVIRGRQRDSDPAIDMVSVLIDHVRLAVFRDNLGIFDPEEINKKFEFSLEMSSGLFICMRPRLYS